MSKKKWVLSSLAAFAIFCVVISTQITIFVIPPIGAIPEGKTLIISRFNKSKFIDSPDAMCERLNNGVSLLCRAVFLGGVTEQATIYVRLPYSKTLYSISTGGNEYTR